MFQKLIPIAICVLAYVVVKLATGGFTIESDKYGYYKDGKLNERGIISIVARVRRLVPFKSAETTLVGITYNYEDGEPPVGSINYYHMVNKDLVEHYSKDSAQVADRFARSQCGNQEIKDMLQKLDHITVSFYDDQRFMYGIKIDSALCDDIEAGKTGEKSLASHPVDASQAKAAAAKHAAAISAGLPLDIKVGILAAVKADDSGNVTHIVEIPKDREKAFLADKNALSDKLVKAYCSNKNIVGLLGNIASFRISFRVDGKEILSSPIQASACGQTASSATAEK